MVKGNFLNLLLSLILFQPFNYIQCENIVTLSSDEIDSRFIYTVPNNTYICTVCEHNAEGFIQLALSGASRAMLERALMTLCIKFSGDGTIGCQGAVSIQLDSLIYIIRNKPNLTGKRVCGIFMQEYGCTDNNMNNWTINLPEKKEFISIAENEVALSNSLTILHLTDIHFDPLYEPGSSAKCDTPLCCQKDSGIPADPKDAAGHWGDYNVCDIPWHSVLNLMDQIKSQHKKIDFIYYTGDIISHINWKTSRKGNTAAITQMFDLLKKTFNTTTVFAVLGNHESHPTNYFSPNNVSIGDISTQWVFDVVANEWSKWLPNSALETIRKGGYYTVLVKSGFRVIGLNSNVCYVNNAWLQLNDQDPFDQLKWLVEVLIKAEEKGEFVHILSHIPPGDKDCYKVWMRQYVNIVKRFSNTIQAQFNGHTHLDEIRLFYDDNDNVINVAYNGASFTTYVGFNPNYRLYDVNSVTYEVQNYDEWIFNLTEANLSPNKPPTWYKLYSFVEDYSVGQLTKQNLNSLFKRLQSDENLAYKYFRYYIRDSDVGLRKGCDTKCLKTLICTINSVYFEDALKC